MKLDSRCFASALVAVAVFCFSLATSHAQITYTWTGATGGLDLDTNWTPSGGPPSAFGDDTAQFTSSGTTKIGLSPAGAFSAHTIVFNGANYTFGSAGVGDSIAVGNGTSGAGSMQFLAGAIVNFSDQTIVLNNSLSWTLSGNSSFNGGSVSSTNLALNIAFGASQLNTARFGSLDLGASGTLVVNNWGGTAGVYGGANNQLRFTVDPTLLLSKISFTGYTGPTVTQFSGGSYEVIPVPEPSTYALLGLALAGVIAFRRRRVA